MPSRPPTHRYTDDPTPKVDLRENSHQRGYDDRWRKFAKWYLQHYPICATKGCGRPAREVDHVIPLTQGGDHCDVTNSQALCKSCHSRKTAMEGMDENE